LQKKSRRFTRGPQKKSKVYLDVHLTYKFLHQIAMEKFPQILLRKKKMTRNWIPLVVIASMLLANSAYAANRFWVGSGNSSDTWEDTANWATLEKGLGGASIPSAADTAVFTFSGNTVQIRSAVTVGGITLQGTGALLQGTGTLAVGTAGIRIGSGSFTGGTGLLTSSGSFTQTGGTVTGIQGTFALSGSLSVTGASSAFTATGNLIMHGGTQTLDSNNSALASLTIASTTSTTLTADQSITTKLQVNTGATFSLDTYTLFATGGTVVNYGTINENTGKIALAATNFIISDSTFTSEQVSLSTPGTLYFTLTDRDENIDGTAADTVFILVSTADGDNEGVTLTETNNTSGIFQGSISAVNQGVNSGSSIIEVFNSQTVTISFTDAQDALSSTDTTSLTIPFIGGGGGNTARLSRTRTAESSTASSAPETEEPAVQVDYSINSVTPREVTKEKSDTDLSRATQALLRKQEGSQDGQTHLAATSSPVREKITENFKIRVCNRVMHWFKGNEKMLDRINRRLAGRFDFECME